MDYVGSFLLGVTDLQCLVSSDVYDTALGVYWNTWSGPALRCSIGIGSGSAGPVAARPIFHQRKVGLTFIRKERETDNPLHLRMNGHRSDYYRGLADKPVAVHLNSPHHIFDDVSVTVAASTVQLVRFSPDHFSARRARRVSWSLAIRLFKACLH